jgi:chloramphenicol O-acetyltransferase
MHIKNYVILLTPRKKIFKLYFIIKIKFITLNKYEKKLITYIVKKYLYIKENKCSFHVFLSFEKQ